MALEEKKSRKDDDQKERENIRRAQRSIEAYALCNDWEYFGTFTLNPQYHDRKDLDAFRAQIMRFVSDQRKKSGCNISVLLVPELHKNKEGWHMHGLIKGLPLSDLRSFMASERLPNYLHQQIKNGCAVYDWPDYRKKFGFVDLEPIRDRDAAARYITKYINKDNDNTASVLELGKHLYFVSRGLKVPVKMENAPGCVPEAFPSGLVTGNAYQYDYGEVQWYEAKK